MYSISRTAPAFDAGTVIWYVQCAAAQCYGMYVHTCMWYVLCLCTYCTVIADVCNLNADKWATGQAGQKGYDDNVPYCKVMDCWKEETTIAQCETAGQV